MVCLGLKTPGNRMVGSDETMELWQARLLHGVAILSLHCNKLFSVRELITNNGQCRGWLERSKYIIRKTHLVAVVTISGQAVGSNNGTVRSPAAELEVIAGLAVEQVGVGQDDAGAVLGSIQRNFFCHNCWCLQLQQEFEASLMSVDLFVLAHRKYRST